MAYLKSPDGQHKLLANASKSVFHPRSTGNIPPHDRDSLPPISEQRAIAEILDSLNDKIASNRRVNDTLETMARAIFKSWFVDFAPVRARSKAETLGCRRTSPTISQVAL